MKIVHITSAHPALDIRIFHKECLTLSQAGHEVHLVVPSYPASHCQGVTIHALNAVSKLTRWQRLYGIYQLAKNISANVYHFHDPEFIPFALLLKLQGKTVIYDVHEDTPRESLSFNRHNKWIARFKYCRWLLLETISKCFLDGFVCATPHIAKHFPSKKSIIIRNYVNTDEFDKTATPYHQRDNTLLYVGGIMRIRGLEQMVTAVERIPGQYQPRLKLIGPLSPPELMAEAKRLEGWNRVDYIQWLTREELLPHFYSAKIGLVLLHPYENFIDALPIKLFEYMAAGLPVIASDFPQWRKIIAEAGCGLLVDPLDVNAIEKQVCYLLDNPHEAEKMGAAGKAAVSQYYAWQIEADRLKAFYHRLEGCLY